jgi:hypothetical protein
MLLIYIKTLEICWLLPFLNGRRYCVIFTKIIMSAFLLHGVIIRLGTANRIRPLTRLQTNYSCGGDKISLTEIATVELFLVMGFCDICLSGFFSFCYHLSWILNPYTCYEIRCRHVCCGILPIIRQSHMPSSDSITLFCLH